jgi:cobalt/nickel transport system permease protein
MTLLAMTTPVPDLLLAARRARVPAVLVELAFLVYRLIASIWELLERLRLGLDLRLRGGKPSLRAATLSAGNLLTRGIQTARRVERGASLRGLDGFPMLTPRAETSWTFLFAAVALHGSLLAAAILLRSRFPW